jgi:hypothetical protein
VPPRAALSSIYACHRAIGHEEASAGLAGALRWPYLHVVTRRRSWPASPVALLATLVAAACAAPEKEIESGRRYLSITYADTTLESFGRTDRSVTGVLVVRSGDSVRFRIRTMPDALVSGVEISLHPASSRGQPIRTTAVDMPKGTLPVMETSVAFQEQLVRRARVVGGDSVSVPVMFVGAHTSLQVVTLIGKGRDSVLVVGPDGDLPNALHFAVDTGGRILGGVIPASGTRILRLAP